MHLRRRASGLVPGQSDTVIPLSGAPIHPVRAVYKMTSGPLLVFHSGGGAIVLPEGWIDVTWQPKKRLEAKTMNLERTI